MTRRHVPFAQRVRAQSAEANLQALRREHAELAIAIHEYAAHQGEDAARTQLAGSYARISLLEHKITQAEQNLNVVSDGVAKEQAAALKRDELADLQIEFVRQRAAERDKAFDEFVKQRAPHLLEDDDPVIEPDAPRHQSLGDVITLSPNTQMDAPDLRRPIKRGPKMFRKEDLLAPRRH